MQMTIRGGEGGGRVAAGGCCYWWSYQSCRQIQLMAKARDRLNKYEVQTRLHRVDEGLLAWKSRGFN